MHGHSERDGAIPAAEVQDSRTSYWHRRCTQQYRSAAIQTIGGEHSAAGDQLQLSSPDACRDNTPHFGARGLLAETGIRNVEAVVGDGSAGLPNRAPFEAIAVHATSPSPPPPLIRQLAPGGRLVIPIAQDTADMLAVFRRVAREADPNTGQGLERTVIGPCRFVPLIGTEGYPE